LEDLTSFNASDALGSTGSDFTDDPLLRELDAVGTFTTVLVIHEQRPAFPASP